MKTGWWVAILLLIGVVAAYFIIQANKRAAEAKRARGGKSVEDGEPSFDPVEQSEDSPLGEPTINVSQWAKDIYSLIVESVEQEAELEGSPPESTRMMSIEAQLDDKILSLTNMMPVNFFGVLNAYSIRAIPMTDSGDVDLIGGYSYSPYVKEGLKNGLIAVISREVKDITGKRCAGGTWQYVKNPVNWEWVCMFDPE
jgi:hypothetical protein